MPTSITLTPDGSSRSREPARDLGAERVVLQPRVADAGDEDLLLELAGHVGTTSTSAGLKYR